MPVEAAQEAGAPIRAPEGMAGLAKGLAIIEAFGQSRSQLMVADAAREAGISRAAARRCLLTLVELGYLTHDGKHFRPTPRMLRLGSSYLEAAPLPQAAQPFLEHARQALDESVSLAVFEQGYSVFVARAQADHIVSTGVRIGARLPAYCSATGRVLLGGLTEAEIKTYIEGYDLQARTDRTLVDRNAVLDAVEIAHKRGYELTDEELDVGMRSIAVPVTDGNGTIIAAMSASAFTARVSLDELLSRFLPELKDHADRLSRTL
jgi:IclR family pca regulon transcriptional regulator